MDGGPVCRAYTGHRNARDGLAENWDFGGLCKGVARESKIPLVCNLSFCLLLTRRDSTALKRIIMYKLSYLFPEIAHFFCLRPHDLSSGFRPPLLSPSGPSPGWLVSFFLVGSFKFD